MRKPVCIGRVASRSHSGRTGMLRWVLFWLAAFGLVSPVSLAVPAANQAPLDSVRLMRVEGKVAIGVDGRVQSAEVSTQRVPPVLRDALLGLARDWQFKPVSLQGKPAQVQTQFELILAARPDGDTFKVTIDWIQFGNRYDPNALLPDGMHAVITPKRLRPPTYPRDLELEGRGGGVLLALLVRADGSVEDVNVLQSLAHDFHKGQGDPAARRTMRVLEANAIRTAKGWTFYVPAQVATLEPARRTVFVPVIYTLVDNIDEAGYWVPVRRGSMRTAPWLPAERTRGLAFGAGGSGTPLSVDSPYVMLRPAAGAALN